jgi:hypothetical protein
MKWQPKEEDATKHYVEAVAMAWTSSTHVQKEDSI